jgi:Rad3-related DNA helicase
MDATAVPVLVEEYKTTRADPGQAHLANASEHWAQARLYAGLLAREGLGDTGFLLRLCYCHPDSLAVTAFEEVLTAAAAVAFLDETLAALRAWFERQIEHETARNVRIASLAFPYGEFRPFQRAMARRAYRALRDRESLLLEAPTGSGKTAATLYPAIRALESAGARRVFFLTSRNTGAHAVQDALARMDPGGEWLRHAQISARDKVCRTGEQPCDPAACPLAQGYYDRVRPAVTKLLERRAMPPEVIAEVADAHRVCPHELALDAAFWADVVIGDYNYLFDPVVRLQRFAGEQDAVVLVDEAHQLAPRVRDMLTLELSRDDVLAALAEAPPEPLAKRLRAIDRQLRALGRPPAEALAGDAEQWVAAADRSPRRPDGRGAAMAGRDEREWPIARPAALIRALERFCDACYESATPLGARPALLQAFFVATRWVRDGDRTDEAGWLYRVQVGAGAGRQVVVVLDCLDPGSWIAERLGEYGGHVRFSGTVSPLPMYQRLHGLADAPAERSGNPFDAGQLGVLLVGDVPTYLQSRSRSLADLVALVHRVANAKSGHYLVAFPSFEYLGAFADALTAAHPEHLLEIQRPGMTDQARTDFLAAFRDCARPRIGLVVLGGVFGESVDFGGAELAGVVCVGLGLPPPSLSRDALAEHFGREGLDGRTIAYLQPAMVKVVQMAGRLLRGPDDRGVLCLVDPRFAGTACRQFFPSHWRPVPVRAAEAPAWLAKFWQEGAGFPRLRASEQESPE